MFGNVLNTAVGTWHSSVKGSVLVLPLQRSHLLEQIIVINCFLTLNGKAVSMATEKGITLFILFWQLKAILVGNIMSIVQFQSGLFIFKLYEQRSTFSGMYLFWGLPALPCYLTYPASFCSTPYAGSCYRCSPNIELSMQSHGRVGRCLGRNQLSRKLMWPGFISWCRISVTANVGSQCSIFCVLILNYDQLGFRWKVNHHKFSSVCVLCESAAKMSMCEIW